MSGRDIAIFASVVSSFAIVVTAHLWIFFGLLARRPRWRAPVALIAIPLAPYWAVRERMTVRGVAWIGGALAYLVASILAAK